MLSKTLARIALVCVLSPAAAFAQGVMPYQLQSTDSPNDNEVPTYDLATEKFTWEAAGGGSGGGHTIQEEGVSLTQRDTLNFIGSAMTCVDNTTKTDCTIAITLGTDTSGSYAAGDAEAGNATGVACTDCVALGTETSGSYAAGDAEAGNATGLACTDCVALGTETTGNYAGSSSEGGAATTATALAADPADCATSTHFAVGVTDAGVATCEAISDDDVPNTITASNYLPLAGGTMTGSIVTDNLGIEFGESDTNPSCGAGEYHVYADLSENMLKKCVNGVSSDLDTGGSTVTLTGDVDGSSDSNDLDEAAVESELEGVLDLQDLQGAVTDTQVPDTITINLAAVATTANAGDSATAFFSSGTIEAARLPAVTTLASACTDGQVLGGDAGGTGVECQADVDTDTNANTICTGTTTYLDGEGNCDDIGTNTGDVTLAGTPDYITISGQVITRNAVDLAADVTGTVQATNFPALTGDVTNSAGSLATTIAVDAVGVSKLDDGTDTASAGQFVGIDPTDTTQFFYGALQGDISGTMNATVIGADKVLESHLKAVNGPTDEYVLTYESTTGDFEWEADTDTTYTAGDFLTLTSTDLDWDGIRLYQDGTDLGNVTSLDFGEDFSTTTQPVCVGGTDAGAVCADIATDTDCAGGGDCVDAAGRIFALNATVYREGDTIAATDMPATGAVDFGGLTSLEVPTSTASGSTTEGYVWFDSNGGTPAIPMPTIGDGTNALPMRACSRQSTGWTTTANNSDDYFFGSGGGVFAASTATIITDIYTKKTTLSALQCNSWEDAASGETAVFTFEHALISTCAASGDNGANTCDLGTPSALTCTITGGSSQTVSEMNCSDTTNSVTVPANSVARFKIDKTGTLSQFFTCSWVECIDSF